MSSTKNPGTKKARGDAAKKLGDLAPDLDAELFASKWNASETLKAFAENLGVSPRTCALVAARLRKLGHDLKWFRKGRPRLLKM